MSPVSHPSKSQAQREVGDRDILVAHLKEELQARDDIVARCKEELEGTIDKASRDSSRLRDSNKSLTSEVTFRRF